MRLCQNLLPRRSQCVKHCNDWAFCSKRIEFSETERFCYSGCTTVTQNQNMYRFVIQLKDHQIVKSAGSKSKQSKKFTRKSVWFLSFLRICRTDSCHVEIAWGVRGTMAGPSPVGGQWCPAPHLKSVPPRFTFAPPVATYYIHRCNLKIWPPFWFLPPLLLNPGDGTGPWASQGFMQGTH